MRAVPTVHFVFFKRADKRCWSSVVRKRGLLCHAANSCTQLPRDTVCRAGIFCVRQISF
jgi:hypothetical protein